MQSKIENWGKIEIIIKLFTGVSKYGGGARVEGLGPKVPLRSAIELDKKGRVSTGYFGKGITKSGLVRVCGCISIISLTDHPLTLLQQCSSKRLPD